MPVPAVQHKPMWEELCWQQIQQQKGHMRPLIVRFILDLENYDRFSEKDVPFIRLQISGFDRKEVIVAQRIAGTEELYVASVKWPYHQRYGQLELGIVGVNGLHVQDKLHLLCVRDHCVVYVAWDGYMAELEVGSGRGGRPMVVGDPYTAIFLHKVPSDKLFIEIIGSSADLGKWEYGSNRGNAQQTGMHLKKDISFVALLPHHRLDETQDVEFKLVATLMCGSLEWEGPPYQNKKVQIPADRDVIIWSTWGESEAQTTCLDPANLLSFKNIQTTSHNVKYRVHNIELCQGICKACPKICQKDIIALQELPQEPIEILHKLKAAEALKKLTETPQKPIEPQRPIETHKKTIEPPQKPIEPPQRPIEYLVTESGDSKKPTPTRTLQRKSAGRKSHVTRSPGHVMKYGGCCACSSVELFWDFSHQL